MQWYYAKHNKQHGPVEEDELFQMARSGSLEPSDLVWNETMDDWVKASTVKGMFTAALTAPAMPTLPGSEAGLTGGNGTTPNQDLMAQARASLTGRWGLTIGAILIYQLILSASQFVPAVGWVASLLISGPMMLGLSIFFIQVARRGQPDIAQLFNGFQRFGTALATYLLMMIYILLWLLLLIIPGIIASYAYAMTFYILADHPEMTAPEAIASSKAMMDGNKWKLFCLYCRFIGWGILCLFTLGIGFLWLIPYVQASTAHFYDDVRGRQSEEPFQQNSL